ncbi:MAG TPA: OB-fold nucleic acid binding domain-containing protein, partial [Bacillota bacterium]|nr:OB-fold nucleic acid binding domain-containing protein [Bacillota bacterium]
MENTSVKSLFRESQNYLGKNIQVSGWVRTIRDSKTFGFIELNDGSFFKNLQVVMDDTLPNFAEVVKLNVGASIIVEGSLVESPGAKQPFELKAAKVAIEGLSSPDYPLQKKR